MRSPWLIAAAAVFLCLPSLDIGFFLDDYIHQAMLTHPPDLPQVHGSASSLFTFVGNAGSALDDYLPWWRSDDLRLAMWRPLTGLTHLLDHRLWPTSPWTMHLHSLLWLVAMVVAAALAYRRLLRVDVGGGAAAAILAAWLFALDDLHLWPALWIANRNALVSMTFGLLALITHDGHRREAWAAGSFWTPLLLLAAVLGGESAVACGAYLLSYAIFLDRGPFKERWLSLLPSALVGVLWISAHRFQGFGAKGSSTYLDPVAEPWRFMVEFWERVPPLMMGLWSPLPADLQLLGSTSVRFKIWWLTVALCWLGGYLLWRAVGRDRRLGFFLFGMAASLVPAAIVTPMNRQLLYAGFGAMGCLGLWLAALFQTIRNANQPLARRGLGLVVALALIVIHGVMAPVSLWTGAGMFKGLSSWVERPMDALPVDSAIVDQRLVIVQVPAHLFTVGAEVYQVLQGRPVAKDLLVLSSGLGPVEWQRLDDHTVRVSSGEGFMPSEEFSPWRLPTATENEAPLDLRRSMTTFDSLFYDSTRRSNIGDRFSRPGVEIEVIAVTADGRPKGAEFRFEVPLTDPSLRWMTWEKGHFAATEPPARGQTVTLPSPSLGKLPF